jgi:predicted nucleic-acid-binding protein
MTTGIDTNILVRFFAKDDPSQASRAREFLQTLTPASPACVSLMCVIELIWVLRSQYHFDKSQHIRRLEQLLDSADLVLENQSAVEQAVRRFAAAKVDFADYLIERSGHIPRCHETVTFDAGAAKSVGMRLL